jgi:HlyD family secretion protein
MNKRLIAVIAVAVVLAAAAIFAVTRRGSEREETIRVSGNFETHEAEAAFQIAGRLSERYVSEGQTVAAGQPVARLDDTEILHEVAGRGADVAAAAAALAELEAGFRPEEIAQARAALRAAESEAARLESDYARQAQLLRDDVIARREFETAEAARNVARSRVEELRQRAALLERGPRHEQITAARARVEQATQARAVAETKLTFTRIVAPFDGVVLEENVEPGETVSPGTPVVTIGNLRRVWLRAFLPQTELAHVRLGQPVDVSVDSFPGRTFPGRISFIASESEFTPKSVQTEKERVKLVYRIRIDVPNPDLALKPGMPADAVIRRAPAPGGE